MGTYGSKEPEPMKPEDESGAREAADRELDKLGLGLQTEEARHDERGHGRPTTAGGHHLSPTREEMRHVVDHLIALPTSAQLGVLRTCAPQIIASLDAHSRDGFMRDLMREIERAIEGGEPQGERPDTRH